MANVTNSSSSEAVTDALNGLIISCSAVVLVVLAFTYQRVKIQPQCLSGYPGMVTPLNLLNQSSYHFVYVIIFGAMSSDFLKQAVGLSLDKSLFESEFWYFTSNNDYVNIFIHTVLFPLIIVTLLSVKYFPLFACVSSPVPILGHVMGILYSILVVSSTVYLDFVNVFSAVAMDTVLLVLGLMPVYICYALVVLWYGWSIVVDFLLVIRNGCGNGITRMREKLTSHDYYHKYVQQLFRSTENTDGKLTKFFRSVANCFFPCATISTRLPLHFVGAMVIVFLILYQLTLTFSVSLIEAMNLLVIWVQSWESASSGTRDTIIKIIKGYQYILPIGCVLSCLICYALLLHMVTCVRKNIRDAMKGKIEFKKMSPSFRVSTSWRYAGYQISFVLAAYIVYSLFLWLVGTFGLAVYFGLQYDQTIVLHVAAYILIPVAWVTFLLVAQIVSCKLLFVRQGGGKFTIITNQRLYHWFSYTLFVYNALLGLAAALLRVLITTVFTSALMIRLDRVVLMKGFEAWDIGHKTYMGFLYLEYAYNNPVVNVFIKLLHDSTFNASEKKERPLSHRLQFGNAHDEWDQELVAEVNESPFCSEDAISLKGRQSYGATPFSINSEFDRRVRSRKARNRWLVAYTLLCNPSLQPLTASRLAENEHAEL